MVAFIKGIVVSVGESSAVIDCNDIGYEIFASSRCLGGLTVGSEVKIHTLLAVREDNITLYGFRDTSEKEMFSRLITVSGIGPKLAIVILSGIDAQSLIGCIASQNAQALAGIKGIGKKTAERILLELKGKIKTEVASGTAEISLAADSDDDAVLALMALGYSSSEAVKALSIVENKDNMSIEEKVMAALRG